MSKNLTGCFVLLLLAEAIIYEMTGHGQTAIMLTTGTYLVVESILQIKRIWRGAR